MQKAYSRINWENYPSDSTPVNESNLNKMDAAIDEMDDRIITLDLAKLSKTTAGGMMTGFQLNKETGVITLTFYDGSTKAINTNLAKIALNITYDHENERLVLTMPDGSVSYVDMSALITQYEFVESDVIYFEVTADGKVMAKIKKGSITEDLLDPNYLAQIKIQASNAKTSEQNALASENNAKASEDAAAESAELAQQYRNEAFSTTQEGYEQAIEDIDLLKSAITQTSSRTHTGSYAGGEKLIGIKGASEQKQYSGKNLLDTSGLKDEVTYEGITYKAVYNNGLLEYVNVNGTSTAVSILNIPFKAYANTEYELSGCPKGGSAPTYSMDYHQGIYPEYGSGRLFTPTEDIDSYVRLRIGNGITVNNLKFYPMVKLASIEDDTYEPYVGNAPSPSPKYPQTIEHSGDIKNLADINTFGALTTHDRYGYEWLDMEGGTYSLSVVSTRTVYVGYTHDGSIVEVGSTSGVTSKVFTFEISDGDAILCWKGSGITDNYITQIQLEKGYPTPYKPYGYGLVIKQVGKNQFDMSQLKNANCVENNGVYSGIISSLYSVFRSGFIVPKLKENTQYTISLYGYVSMDGATPRVYVRYADASEAVIAINIKDTSMTGYTYTTREGMTVSDIYFDYGAEGQETVYLKDFQIEEGDTATAYEPYQSNTIDIPLNEPLRGIDDCKDGFVFKYERWRIERNCYGFWLNGSENWQINDYNNSYYSDIVNGITASGVITKMLSDSYIFTTEASSQMADKTIKTSWSGETSLIILRDTSYANVAELKAGLAKNPVFCVVKRAEPIYEDIEDQTPFYNLKSYDTVTYISTDSKVEPEVIVKYGKTEVGALTLENSNLHALVDINRQNHYTKAEVYSKDEVDALLKRINDALPYTITIDDEAQTIDFTDRE